MNSRFKELFGMILIGDGILNLIQPERHSAIWNCGPEFYKTAARRLERKPLLARVLGVGLLAAGIALGRTAGKTNFQPIRRT